MPDAHPQAKPVRLFTPPPAKPLRWRQLLTWLRSFTWRTGALALLLIGATVLFAFTRDPWVRTGEIVLPQWQWLAPARDATPVVFTPDGRRILIGRKDGFLAIHGAVTGRQLDALPGGPPEGGHLAVSADGRWALSVGGTTGRGRGGTMSVSGLMLADTAVLWDLQARQPVKRWNVVWRPTLPQFSPDGERIWINGEHGLMMVAQWARSRASRLDMLAIEVIRKQHWRARFCTDGEQLLACRGAEAVLLNGRTGQRQRVLWEGSRAHMGPLDAIPLPNGNCLVIAVPRSSDPRSGQRVLHEGEAVLWVSPETKATRVISLRHTVLEEQISVSPDGKRFVLSEDGGPLRAYRAANGRRIDEFNPSEVCSDGPIAFSPDGAFLLTGLSAGWPHYSPYLLDGRSGEVRFRFIDASHGPVNGVAFSADGRRLLIAAGHHRVELYEKRHDVSSWGPFARPAFWAMAVLAMAIPFNVLRDARRALPAVRRRPVLRGPRAAALILAAIAGLALLDVAGAATTHAGRVTRWPPYYIFYRVGIPALAVMCVLMGMELLRGNRAWQWIAALLSPLGMLYLGAVVFGYEYRTTLLAGGSLPAEVYGLPMSLSAHAIAWALAILFAVVACVQILLIFPVIRWWLRRRRWRA